MHPYTPASTGLGSTCVLLQEVASDVRSQEIIAKEVTSFMTNIGSVRVSTTAWDHGQCVCVLLQLYAITTLAVMLLLRLLRGLHCRAFINPAADSAASAVTAAGGAAASCTGGRPQFA